MAKTITMDIEQILLDFYNSNTIDEILNDILGVITGKPIPKKHIDRRNEIAIKHIRKWLESYKINKGED